MITPSDMLSQAFLGQPLKGSSIPPTITPTIVQVKDEVGTVAVMYSWGWWWRWWCCRRWWWWRWWWKWWWWRCCLRWHYLASGGGAMMNNTGKLVTAVKSDSLNWGTWTCFYWAWNYYITFLMLIKWKYSPQSWMGMSPASATERREKARRTQSIFWKNFHQQMYISVQVHLAFRWVQISTNTEEVARAGRLFMSEPNQKYK